MRRLKLVVQPTGGFHYRLISPRAEAAVAQEDPQSHYTAIQPATNTTRTAHTFPHAGGKSNGLVLGQIAFQDPVQYDQHRTGTP